MPMTLGYWNIRGLAHSIRLLLEYTGSSYEEKKYTMGDGNGTLVKNQAGLDFPNLPYLIDGTHKITQSNAILRYIARKHNLCGETEKEKIWEDILENQLMDNRMQLARLCYDPDFEKLKPEYLEGLPEMLKLYSQFLGKQPWFLGDKITFVDFIAYDVLERNQVFEPSCLDAFPNLKDFISRFEVMPLSSFLFMSLIPFPPLWCFPSPEATQRITRIYGHARWLTPVISALWRLRQADHLWSVV
uniref:glutathione transferase n=1 Tax=Rhinopithecus bieti TaxID=61621 RepID=A0A2K6MHX2_RHIBE